VLVDTKSTKKVFKEYKPPTLRKAKAVEANGELREVAQRMTQGDQKAKTDLLSGV